MSDNLSSVQQQASDPEKSVWLAAHAGTGKTKVLVDRILRLLISGVCPGSILSITYTKAAAAEMQLRIRKEVAEWASLSEDVLRNKIEEKIQKTPSQNEMERARGLLILLTESRESLQIMTIHGFCQSLLMRFPLEAGLSGSPEVMQERVAADLLAQARAKVFAIIQQGNAPEVAEAMQNVVMGLGDGGVDDVMKALVYNAQELFALLEQPDGILRYREAIRDGLGLIEPYNWREWSSREPMLAEDIHRIIEILQQGAKTDQTLAEAMADWHETRDEKAIEAYATGFITQKGEPRKRLITQAIAKKEPELADLLRAQQQWIYGLMQTRCEEGVARLSESVMVLGEALLANYQFLKSERGLLDFGDVITAATALLTRPGYCEWVLSKLDWQIGHVMLDEAQDTSAQQWHLLRVLVEELFVPELYENSPRTLFVVGDKKQSIYRFQGADPEGFRRHGEYYEQWFAQTDQPFVNLSLEQSFRSTQAVLGLVDAVCLLPVMQAAVDELDVDHKVFRDNHRGMVTLWPLLETQEKQDVVPPWEVESPNYSEQNITQNLARNIAEDMAARITSGVAKPADMLVLVQRRTGFIEQLTRELQLLDVAVAGADRLRLSSHLAVKDILVLAEWCLLSADDLALATVLKGPLFNYSEDALFEIAHGREGKSLWLSLQKSENESVSELLKNARKAAKDKTPFEWLCFVLDDCGMSKGLLAQFGVELQELITELKRQALLFEKQETAHLQLFVQWLQDSDLDIKREMEQGQNAVRIMTIHGSKGLQAPIVYLPDTVRVPNAREAVVWQHVNNVPVAYVAPQGSIVPDSLQAMKQSARDADMAEYYRLLYVALTRAEDELIITGYESRKTTSDDCWYRLIEKAMQQMGCEADENGMLRYASGEDVKQSKPLADIANEPLPAWTNEILSQPDQPRTDVLSPSQLVDYIKEDDDAHNGLGRERGNLTHALLQILSSHPAQESELLAIANKIAPSFSAAKEVVRMVMDTQRQHPWIFGEQTYAEVILQGEVIYNDERISLRGQVDRLIIEPTRVLVVDYKSNATVPDEMPNAYAVQLAAYVSLLAPLYPTHNIQAALLWTETGKLDYADGAFLETLCKADPRRLDSNAA